MDTDIIRMKKFISIFILNEYWYNSNTESINIIIDITLIIKFYNYGIKGITKYMINQVNNMFICYIFF